MTFFRRPDLQSYQSTEIVIQFGFAKLEKAWSGDLRARLLVRERCDGDLFDTHGDD